MTDYKASDLGSVQLAVINILSEDGEEQYEAILNNPKHWVRPDDIKIISHERHGAIYAVIKYWIINNDGLEAPTSLSPRDIIKKMNEREDEKQREAMEEGE